MSRLEQLYQDTILEHNRNPRNFRKVEPCTHSSHGLNPLCGDDYYVYLTVEGDQIADVAFHGAGCAISKSSGSLMTHTLKGKTVSEALALKDAFLDLVMDTQSGSQASLGSLKVFEGVKKYPVRVKCATLVWRALEDALQKSAASAGVISTE